MSESGSDVVSGPALAQAALGTRDDRAEERAGAALGPLERLAGLPVREHVGVFEEVFAGLEATLASVDDPARSDSGAHGL